jgi:enamine deaminase RidA (YjgF/YER057c/UK114 family)
MTPGLPPDALNPQERNIMSIVRHEIRKISDDNRGQPIISQAVVHGNVAYFAGITPNPIVGDIKTQTAQVLRRVDELLNLVGTDKSQLLSAQVWIADMRLFMARGDRFARIQGALAGIRKAYSTKRAQPYLSALRLSMKRNTQDFEPVTLTRRWRPPPSA